MLLQQLLADWSTCATHAFLSALTTTTTRPPCLCPDPHEEGHLALPVLPTPTLKLGPTLRPTPPCPQGDLALLARPGGRGLPQGHIVAYKPTHRLHREFLHKMQAQISEWECSSPREASE